MVVILESLVKESAPTAFALRPEHAWRRCGLKRRWQRRIAVTEGVQGEADTALSALIARLRPLLGRNQPLPAERPLAARLGVKRHQLRRALEAMRESGEFDVPTGRQRLARRGRNVAGSTASTPVQLAARALSEATSPVEVIEVRIAIEPMLARLAAWRASPSEIERIQMPLSASVDGDHERARAADLAFHQAIATAAHNTLAQAMLELTTALSNDHRLRMVLPSDTLARERDEHEAIAAAIAKRDPVAAERAMMDHLQAAELWLQRRLKN